MAKRRKARRATAPKTGFDPSTLPGTYRTRVFVGGSYRAKPLPSPSGAAVATRRARRKPTPRELLDQLREVVVAERFHPILAAEFKVEHPEKEIHHDALYLLHACRLAIFDLSEFSGALMEIERAADYATHCLILHEDPIGAGWRVSWMLSSFVEEHQDRFELYGYINTDDAQNRARNWLREMRRRGYV
jgi:hypothetical protein